MNLDWQNAIVVLAILAACGYLAMQLRQVLARRAAACGGCRGCAAGADRREPEVVSLSPAGRPDRD